MSKFDKDSLSGRTCIEHRRFRCSDCAWVEIDSLREELRRQSQELERAREALETIANGEVPENDPDQSFRDAVILFASHTLAQPAQKQGEDRG
jgi:hypothetical protein